MMLSIGYWRVYDVNGLVSSYDEKVWLVLVMFGIVELFTLSKVFFVGLWVNG